MTRSLLTNCCGGNGRRAIGIGQAQHEWLRDIARNLACHVSLGSRGVLLAFITGAWLSGAGCHPAEDEGEAIGSRNERPETEFLVFDLIKKRLSPNAIRHAAGYTLTVTGKVCGFVNTAHGHDLFKEWPLVIVS